ncbi:MAG: hypothetical protein HXX11_14940 [Desulfuromonadales bacterium]|nr:hypothetical protein [Desulfuromonadales bacterium]
MRIVFVVSMVMALVVPVGAETYSWLDESGTFHFTEDLSRVPKKYRNKVNLHGDMSSGQAQIPATAGSTKMGAGDPSRAAVSAGKAALSPDDPQKLYGGRTEAAWRSDLTTQERELHRLEGVLDQLRKKVTAPSGVSRDRLAELKREYNETRTVYDRKYAIYSDSLESARKAGFTVEIK